MASAGNLSKRLLAGVTMMLLTSLPPAEGHGRLMEPPSRSSMWRSGFNTPRNYDDNALNCGGLNTEWYVNHGKCGVCGDPWDQPAPRDNEAGGLYGKGIITRTYSTGQVIEVRVQITANHKGWFEFRMCVHNDPSTPITHDCLNQHLLELADGSGTHYTLDPNAQDVRLKLKLPAAVSCSQCVLQWKWHGGNNPGSIQEEFYGCSDIAIGVSAATTPPPSARPTSPPTHQPTNPGGGGQTVAGSGSCHAIGQFQGVPDLEWYCREQCLLGNCPSAYCACSSLPATVSVNPLVTLTPSSVATATPTVTTAHPKMTTTTPPASTTSPSRSSSSATSATNGNQSGKMVQCRAVGVWQGVPELDVYCNEHCPKGDCPVQCSCTAVQSSTAVQPPHTTTTITTSTSTASPTTTTRQIVPFSSKPLTTKGTIPFTATSAPTTSGGHGCVAVGLWQGDASKDQWCNANCPTLCPALSCRCGAPASVTTAAHSTSTSTTTTTSTSTSSPTTKGAAASIPAGSNPCRAVGPWAGDAMLDAWCKQTCSHYSGCDPHYCFCDGATTMSSSSSSSPTTTTTTTTTGTSSAGRGLTCRAINGWAGNPDLDLHCERECNSGGLCPPEYCSCTSTTDGAVTTTTPSLPCYAINSWAGVPELDTVCDTQCKAGHCPPQYCACGPTSSSTPSNTTTITPSPGSGGGQQGCRAVGTVQGVPEMDDWCRVQCAQGKCPPVYCAC